MGPEIENFLGPEMATSEASAIGAKKNRDFRAHPVERLYYTILCLVSSKILTHWLGGEEGVNNLEDADTALYSTYVSTLWPTPSNCPSKSAIKKQVQW